MSNIQMIGEQGQIHLGSEFTGQHASVDQIEPGVWVVKVGKFIPDNEKWLHQEPFASQLKSAIQWAENSPAEVTKIEQLESSNNRN